MLEKCLASFYFIEVKELVMRDEDKNRQDFAFPINLDFVFLKKNDRIIMIK